MSNFIISLVIEKNNKKMDLSIAYEKELTLNSEKPQGKIRENDENEDAIILVHVQ